MELFKKYPALRSRLKWIFDKSKERPDNRHGSQQDRSRHSSNGALHRSQCSPEQRLAYMVRLLEKELNEESSECTGIQAFSDMVGQATAEQQGST